MVGQGNGDEKRAHIIRDSYYYREKGAVKMEGGMAANTSKI